MKYKIIFTEYPFKKISGDVTGFHRIMIITNNTATLCERPGHLHLESPPGEKPWLLPQQTRGIGPMWGWASFCRDIDMIVQTAK